MANLNLLSNAQLLQTLDESMKNERLAIARQLELIAEVDERKAFLDRGHPTMHDYCIEHHHLTEPTAWKRVTAARAARRFPQLLRALTDGRLHLTAITLISPRLTDENIDSLTAAATHRTVKQIEAMLRPAPEPLPVFPVENPGALLDSNPVEHKEMSGQVGSDEALAAAPPSPFAPAPIRRAVTCMFDDETVALLERLQDLYSHQVPTRDAAEVLKRCMRADVQRLERRKFGASSQPRASQTASEDPRLIPAHVKQQVYARDGGQCTFTGDRGHRCASKHQLEYDHIVPIADGGTSTVDNLRLLCRAHNQHVANQRFGRGFMDSKRRAASPTPQRANPHYELVVEALKALRMRPEHIKSAAEAGAAIPGATIEEAVKAALKVHVPRGTVILAPGAAAMP